MAQTASDPPSGEPTVRELRGPAGCQSFHAARKERQRQARVADAGRRAALERRVLELEAENAALRARWPQPAVAEGAGVLCGHLGNYVVEEVAARLDLMAPLVVAGVVDKPELVDTEDTGRRNLAAHNFVLSAAEIGKAAQPQLNAWQREGRRSGGPLIAPACGRRRAQTPLRASSRRRGRGGQADGRCGQKRSVRQGSRRWRGQPAARTAQEVVPTTWTQSPTKLRPSSAPPRPQAGHMRSNEPARCRLSGAAYFGTAKQVEFLQQDLGAIGGDSDEELEAQDGSRLGSNSALEARELDRRARAKTRLAILRQHFSYPGAGAGKAKVAEQIGQTHEADNTDMSFEQWLASPAGAEAIERAQEEEKTARLQAEVRALQAAIAEEQQARRPALKAKLQAALQRRR